MEHVATRFRDHLVEGAIPLAVLASLPFVGLLIFAFRPVLLLAAIVALGVGGLLWAISSRCQEWIDAQAGTEIGYRGLRLAPDRAFDPHHSWAEMSDVVVVGADDLVQAALGPVEKVELPPNGLHVQRGDRLFRLRSADRSIDVRAPVSGTVIARNEALRTRPGLVNERPFRQGWVVRLRADDLPQERQLLLRGKRARAWFHDEVDRVIQVLPDEEPDEGTDAPAFPEERVPAEQIHRRIDDAAWHRLTETVFSPDEA